MDLETLLPLEPVIRHVFSGLNVEPESIPEDLDVFELTAREGTGLWRKPASRDTSTAPIIFTALRYPFISAEVTVSADWRLEWDQAGLVLFTGAPLGDVVQPPPELDDAPPPYTPTVSPSRWVKIGLEYIDNTPHLSSTHAAGCNADWSLIPLPSYHDQRDDLRVRILRLGDSLGLHYKDLMYGWRKVREINGFFFGADDKSLRVGVYASRPTSWKDNPRPPIPGLRAEDLDINLRVGFEDLKIF